MQTNTASSNGAVQVAAETQNINNLPEWLRVPAACQRFGVSRSWLYERIASGEIRSTALRKRGAVKGIRLISRDSMAAFIEASAEGGEA